MDQAERVLSTPPFRTSQQQADALLVHWQANRHLPPDQRLIEECEAEYRQAGRGWSIALAIGTAMWVGALAVLLW